MRIKVTEGAREDEKERRTVIEGIAVPLSCHINDQLCKQTENKTKRITN